MNYFFEKIQKIKFVLMDADTKSEDDEIGQMETNVATIMGSNS